jgi:hypothetical protein
VIIFRPRLVFARWDLVAFMDQNPETGRDVWVLNLADRKAEPFLKTTYEETAPKFSPDGNWLAYSSLFDAPHNNNRESREAAYGFFSRHLLERTDRGPLEEPEGAPTPIEQLMGLPRTPAPNERARRPRDGHGVDRHGQAATGGAASRTTSEASTPTASSSLRRRIWPAVVAVLGCGLAFTFL